MSAEDEQRALDRAKARLVALDDALDALASGVQEYSLNTGQTTQRVTRVDMDRLQASYDATLNRIAILEQRLGIVSGTHYAEPST
jgi:hypothetical protein